MKAVARRGVVMLAAAALIAFLGSCGAAKVHTAPWLGLNYNSNFGGAGPTAKFSRAPYNIVFDREGNIEPHAGDTPLNDGMFRLGLRTSIDAGMVPDMVVDPDEEHDSLFACPDNSSGSRLCLPTSQTDIAAYVHGFVATASSVLRYVASHYPGHQVLFEPMDEPWDFAAQNGKQVPNGRVAATQYADILAQLLPAAAAAGVPLDEIYVPGTGELFDRTYWIPDMYQAQPCLKANAQPCLPNAPPTPIAGWNLHPYGRPNSKSEGIESVPGLRSQMSSGQDNIVVSEIGFCALDVAHGADCQAGSDINADSSTVAAWLTRTLQEASPMHQAGWLKALIIWARDYPFPPFNSTGTGRAMQNPDGSLTAMGRALEQFALTQIS